MSPRAHRETLDISAQLEALIERQQFAFRAARSRCLLPLHGETLRDR